MDTTTTTTAAALRARGINMKWKQQTERGQS